MQMSLLRFSKIRSIAKVQKALNEGSMKDEENRESFFHRCHSGQKEDHKDSSGLVLLAQMMMWQDAGHPCTSWEGKGTTLFHWAQSKTNLQHTVCTSAMYPSMQEALNKVWAKRPRAHTIMHLHAYMQLCTQAHSEAVEDLVVLRSFLVLRMSWQQVCTGDDWQSPLL